MPNSMTKGLAVVAIALLLATACNKELRGTSHPPKVIYTMVLEPVACEGNGTACFMGTVKNVGVEKGRGSCQVVGWSDETGDVYTKGPTYPLELGPGETLTVKVVWTKAPEKQYTANCEPGPVA